MTAMTVAGLLLAGITIGHAITRRRARDAYRQLAEHDRRRIAVLEAQRDAARYAAAAAEAGRTLTDTLGPPPPPRRRPRRPGVTFPPEDTRGA